MINLEDSAFKSASGNQRAVCASEVDKGDNMKFFLVVMSLLMATAANAATLESKLAARKLTDQVMTKVAAGDIESGFMLMKPYSILPESEVTVAIEQTKLQLPLMQGRFGKTVGVEFIREKSVGSSLLQIEQIQSLKGT